jgi:hypothetical protein
VRALSLRVVRIVFIGFIAYAAVAWANAHGMARVGYACAAAVLSVFFGISLLRAHRSSQARREARWERAIYEAKGRARALAEVARAVHRLSPSASAPRAQNRAEHARLSIMLAELHDADRNYDAAMRAVDVLAIEALPALDAGLVRHTRSVTHLRAGDPQGALAALEQRTSTGDVELDQRLALLEAYARIELGDIADGLASADAMLMREGVEPSVVIEARIVRAAALDALGKREEALVALLALDRSTLAPLSELGHPRVRALAQSVLDGSAA